MLPGRGRLRSVQIHFHIPSGQDLQAVEETISALTATGASVSCDVGIWAQNDEGIEEIAIDELLEERLKRKGIVPTIYKKPLSSN